MGFDSLASQAIMFIAVLGASALLIASFSDQVSTTTNAMSTQQDSLEYQIKTAINIETAAYNSTANKITFYARNTGVTSLLTNKLSIYIDTSRISTIDQNVTVVSDTSLGGTNMTIWDPAEVIMGNLTMVLTSGTLYTLKIVTQYETADSFEFTA